MIGGLPSSVAILGSTGSVGEQAIDVALKNNIPVDLIAARSSVGRLEEQIRLLKPRICAVTDRSAAKDLLRPMAANCAKGAKILRPSASE